MKIIRKYPMPNPGMIFYEVLRLSDILPNHEPFPRNLAYDLAKHIIGGVGGHPQKNWQPLDDNGRILLYRE